MFGLRPICLPEFRCLKVFGDFDVDLLTNETDDGEIFSKGMLGLRSPSTGLRSTLGTLSVARRFSLFEPLS